MSERMTLVGKLCDRLAVTREKMGHDIFELSETRPIIYNPTAGQMREIIRRYEDDHHELMALMDGILKLDPVPDPPRHGRTADDPVDAPAEWTIE